MARRILHLTLPLPSPDEAMRLGVIDKKEASMAHWRGKAMSNDMIGMYWDEFAVGCLFGLLVGGLVMFGIMV